MLNEKMRAALTKAATPNSDALGRTLLLGFPGSGKTPTAFTAPRSEEKPMIVLSADFQGWVHTSISEAEKDGSLYVLREFEMLPPDMDIFARITATVRELHAKGVFKETSTLVLDSISGCLSHYQNFLQNKKAKDGTRSVEAMTNRDWGLVLSKVKDLMYAIFTLPCHVVVTCHLKNVYTKDPDDQTQKVLSGYAPTIAGQSSEWIPANCAQIIQTINTNNRYAMLVKPVNMLPILRVRNVTLPQAVYPQNLTEFYKLCNIRTTN